MESKWKSRKLWMAVATLLFLVLTTLFKLDIPAEQYWGIVAVASSYVFGQSIVDAKK